AGLQLLAGHPEEWVYTLFALATYGLAWSVAAGWRAWPRRAVAAILRLGGVIVVLGLLFAWQLLPTLVLQRQGWRTSPGFDEQYELPARLAFNALLPDYGNTLSGENVGFIGLVALALAGLGVWAGPRRLALTRLGGARPVAVRAADAPGRPQPPVPAGRRPPAAGRRVPGPGPLPAAAVLPAGRGGPPPPRPPRGRAPRARGARR